MLKESFRSLTYSTVASLLALFFLFSFPTKAEAACSSPAGVAGEALYNADHKEMQYCDNTNWVSMGRGPEVGAGCTSPVATAGHMMFNKDYRVMQYCNGHEWVQMGIAGGDWKQISTGGVSGSGAHTCGIKTDDTLWCWGWNNGQVGDGASGANRYVPTAVSGGGTWKQVSAGGSHTCGIKADDTMWCWGNNTDGQIGDNTSGTNRLVPTAINGGGTWKQVSAGGNHTCGIKTDDSLWCWGQNTSGQIGDNTTGTDRLIPTAVNGGGTWKQAAAGYSHTCGIKSDDTLWCWGNSGNGQSVSCCAALLVPTAVSNAGAIPDTWKSVDLGDSHTCAVSNDGTNLDTLWCWGYNNDGRLGNNLSCSPQCNTPTVVVNTGAIPDTWKSVASGGTHTCAVSKDGTNLDTLWCWGGNTDGQIGDNSTTQRNIPTAVSGGGTWQQASGGGTYACGLRIDNTLLCWGYNVYGQIGDNSSPQRLIPTAINGGGTWKQVSASGLHTCGIKSDDTLWCWGYNAYGQLGDNTSGTDRIIPTAINGGGTWKQASTGYHHTCGIKSDDSVWCWGRNAWGQLGDSTSGTNRLIPTAVSGGGTWKQVRSGRYHTCGIKIDDSLWCWGNNPDGRVGDNTSGTDRLIPTAISGGGTWKQVSGGDYHTCGIKTDDSLWCWGANGNGQLGDNTSGTNRLIPTAINGGGTWKQVSAGGSHTCGIKTDDSLWCWGYNANGQLGDNSTTQRLIPTAVNGGGTWKQISTGYTHTCGVKTDDTPWCWGQNSSGHLGDNTQSQRQVPTAVNGSGTWKQTSCGFSHTCGIRSDDSLWCWGNNQYGEITATDESAPYKMTGVLPWCVLPSAKPGTVLYNADFAILQYCGGSWRGIGK